jgi:hypothetical protein
MAQPTRLLPLCPVCTQHQMDFCCRVSIVEVYGCKFCGARLSLPVATSAR